MAGKILFIGPHRPYRNGSQRFRMEQFFPYLEKAGYVCDYSWFIDEKDDRVFYSHGNWIGKFGVYLKALRVRLSDVLGANRYDIIFVQREAFMTGSVFFERQFSRSRARLIYDFDDAIWLEDTSAYNRKLKWLKRPGKTADIIKLSDGVITGNSFLATYARQFNENVLIIPTVIDTETYLPVTKSEVPSAPVCIGWSGSKTSVKHFATILHVLERLHRQYGDRICFRQIGDKSFQSENFPVESSDWKYEQELEDLRKIDIGIMPLPDDDWSRGKCSFKALQYMALEIPPVISPVGMNSEVIIQGVNGFLADSEEDWMKYLTLLIESKEQRKLIGLNARKTVEEKYSVQSQIYNLTKFFDNVKAM